LVKLKELRLEIEALSYGVPVKRYARNASGSLWADAAARRPLPIPRFDSRLHGADRHVLQSGR
jgi:hypothetical protein